MSRLKSDRDLKKSVSKRSILGMPAAGCPVGLFSRTKPQEDITCRIRSSFKNFPEFAGIFYSNPLIKFTGSATVIEEMYTDILRRLRDAVRRNLPEIWRTSIWFLLHDNAPAHRSVYVKDFLTKNYVMKLELSHTSPGLVQMIFTFPSTDISIEGRTLL